MSGKYKKLSQIEHVLKRPGMYIGDIKNTTSENWILEDSVMTEKIGEWNPGIYKLFDEIITNASDEAQRNSSVTEIKITFNEDSFSVYNNSGIPIEILPEHGDIYVPELIFTNLLTSSNFDDSIKRTTGGLHGLGAKLTAIFSKKFIIETCKDSKKYHQVIENNLSVINKPKITSSSKEYTKITFTPDLSKFNISEISDFTLKILEKRVYDISAITSKNVNVYLNNKKIACKNFLEYTKLYNKCPTAYQEDKRWKVVVAPSENGFKCISFVNGINTIDGGTHVDHVVNPIIKKISEHIQNKHKQLKIKPQFVKDNLFLFINCLIENPSFSSQSKEKNITKITDFGSRFVLSENLIKDILKLGIIENILILADEKEKKKLKKTDGKKNNRINIPKLDDANKAGGKESDKCTIIFTEGDSAKTTAVSGLSVVGRDYYGAFPLKGKILNTRTASYTQISNNAEINNIKQILGLQSGKKYKNVSELRYGRILIMTDADTDGFHIKSLLINFINNNWPELTKLDFISSLVTPVVKINKKQISESFYNLNDYNTWKEKNNINGWKIKYYKGLGTSTNTEAKEYFKNMKILNYKIKDDTDQAHLDLAFTKTEADSRKKWIIENIKNPKSLDYNIKDIPMKDLINKELVLFSIEDNIRSIPNLVDGFKPSQRKVIFSCIKKKLNNEIKVSQLSGYVSENTSYHHGESSLMDTIINLCQDFVGSNNIPLLQNIGQFGSRLQGGKDSSSPRYIFTQLSNNFYDIFNPDDFELIEYLNDDGFPIEPKYYVPVLPLILINGASGIGTGFSTDIPCFNPKDIKKRLLDLTNDEDSDIDELTPWYKNFKGKIIKIGENKWTTHGIYKINRNTITITELPVGTWTEDYKTFLDKLEIDNIIFSYKNLSSEELINFEIKIPLDTISAWEENKETEKKLKLIGHLSASNMHLFDSENKIKKMESPEEILYCFWKIREEYYTKRKIHKLSNLNKTIKNLKSKIDFLNDVITDKIKIFRVKIDKIEEQLLENNYEKIDNSFKYLTDMKIYSFTEENLLEMNKKLKINMEEWNEVNNMKNKDFWKKDLSNF